MRISSAWYSFRQGIKNIRRNLLFSLASIGTMISCLFLFGLFFCVIVNLRTSMKKIESTISISVFFDEGISEDNIKLIQEQIRVRPEINTLDFISAEEAWMKFSEENYDDPEAAREAFGDDNPLANSASFKITLKDVSTQTEIVQFIKGLNGVRKVKDSKFTAESVSAINLIAGYTSLGIIVILLFVSIFLISNTITIGITVRKEEIKIMKLIGATNFFVRSPFIVEGVIIGFIGSALPLVLLYYLYQMAMDYVLGRFIILKGLFEFIPVMDIFKILVPISLGIGIGIGLLGSLITTRKHLKV